MNSLAQTAAVRGDITAKFYNQDTLTRLEKFYNRQILKFRKAYPAIMKFYRLGKLKQIDEHKNVICVNGFNAVMRRLSGDTTYTGTINKMLLGTGVTTAAAADTQLATEAYRNAVASATAVDNVAYITAYFSETECSGTYKEFGNVIDGTASANTGRLWSHLAGLNWVKDASTVLVVSCKYTGVSV